MFLLLLLLSLLLLYQWLLFTLSILFLRVQCDMFSVSVCLWSSFCLSWCFCYFFGFFCVDKLHLQSVPLRYVTVRGACWLLVLATPMKLRHPFSDVHSHFCFLVFNKYHHKLFFFFLPSCPGVCEIKKNYFITLLFLFFPLLFPMKIQCYGSLTFCP